MGDMEASKKTIKALIVFREDDTDNQFVHILCQAICRQGIDAHCSVNDFWEGNGVYDIIHFQWPEEVVGWSCTDATVIERLKQQIEHFKANGSRFVYTRHNNCPHYGNPIIKQAYEVIESCSDIVVHMGRYSREEFIKKYPESRNAIIPHHIYENTYREDIPQKEAREHLGISENRFVVTAFGKFRNREEIAMVVKSYLHLCDKKKYLLAPRMLPFTRHPRQRNPLKRILSLAGYFLAPPLMMLKGIRAGANDELISNEELPYYLAASDVIYVQRKQILNSGNIPLAFLFGKVVIGPDIGNVGELLRDTGNPVFDPESTTSITNALKEARQLVGKGKGKENHQYALQQMNLEKVAREYAKLMMCANPKNECTHS